MTTAEEPVVVSTSSSSSSSHEESNLPKVCVTGASGFIGTHVVKQLLESGKYFVHATVRDANDTKKAAHLKEFEGGESRLKLFSADLLNAGSFDEPIKGCLFVFHIAASVRMTAPDPQREIVDVGVKGTQNVFESVEKSRDTVKRVVMTSSVAAIHKRGVPHDTTFTEADWNDTATVEKEPYPLEKVLSEKWSLEFCKDKPYDVVHINPGLVLGPVFTEIHLRSSPTIIHDFAVGKFPMAPRLSFPVVHVEDVAKAHIIAAERWDPNGPTPEKGLKHIPGGTRFIMSLPRSVKFLEMAVIMKQKYPTLKAPTTELWNWLMYVTALFDKRLSWDFLKENLDKQVHFNNAKAIEELGIQFHTTEECIYDTVASFIERKFIPPVASL